MRRTLATALITALTTALGLVAAAQAADWRTSQDAYESGLFLNVSSYKLLPDGRRQIQVLRAFQPPLQTRGGVVDFRIELFDLDCPHRTLATRYAVVVYMDGRSDLNEQGSAASPVAAGTNGERLWDAVCEDMSRLTAVPGDAPSIAQRYRALSKVVFQ